MTSENVPDLMAALEKSLARAKAHTVQRDQCRGTQPYRCVSCDRPIAALHDVLCYVYAKARQDAEGIGGATDESERNG